VNRVELGVKAVAVIAGRVPLVRMTSESEWHFPTGEYLYGHQMLDRACEVARDQMLCDFEALSVLSQQERLFSGRHEFFVLVRGVLHSLPRAAEGYELVLISQDNLHVHVGEIDPHDLIILEHVLFTPVA